MYAIKMQDITRTFHDSYANREVSLKVEQGEIHSLLGEDDVGKITLMRISFGLYKANKGWILINGSPVAVRSFHDAIDYGISMIHQHSVLIGSLIITENIVLGHEPRKDILPGRGKAYQKVDALTRRYHFDLNPGSRIKDLSVGEKQWVEILKALYNKSSIILSDESTAVLTSQEVQELSAMLRQLKKDDRTVIIITHRLKEAPTIADNVTILRRGGNTASFPVTRATKDKPAELMAGRPISSDVQRIPYNGSGPVKLSLKNICLKKKGRPVLADTNLEYRAGKALGITGVEGNRQTEPTEVVTGIKNHFTGQICCGSQPVSTISSRRVLDYVGHIPEEHGRRGSVKGFSNWENPILGYHYQPEYVKHGFLDIGRIRQVARDTVKQFDVRTDGIDRFTSSPSEGNQQKPIIECTLLHQSNTTVTAQPTRDMDIEAIEYIHRHLTQMRDSGSAILLISADLDEVTKLVDRIAAFYEDRVVAEEEIGAFTKAKLGYYMLGDNARKGAADSD